MEDADAFDSKLFASLLDAGMDGVLAFDRECRYTVWNSAMERISGLRRDEVLGRRAFDLFPFLLKTGEDNFFYEALAGRRAVAAARPYTIPETGRRGLFDGHYSPLRDERGEVVGGVAIIRDITDSHEAGEALRQSEERYRAFIANSSEGVWRFELDSPVPADLTEDEQIEFFYRSGYLAECNDAMARMYGFDRAEELVGARLADLLLREDPRNEEYLRAFIRAGYRLTDAESIESDREGRRRFFSNNLVGVIEDGLLRRAWGTQRDITERRRVEEALRESEEKYRSLLENANDLIYSHDLEGNYLTVNRACAEITGYTREEILGGLNVAQVVVPEHLGLAREMIERKLRDPSPTVYEVDIFTKDRRRLTLEVSTRIARRDGRGPVVEGIARDVTDRKGAEREREELLERERRARREAEESLATARSIEESLGLLVDASGVMLGSLTLDEVQPAILQISRRLISADAYAIWRVDAAARVWRIVTAAGLSEGYRERVIANNDSTAFVLEGPVVAEDIERVPMLEDRRDMYRSEGVRSLLVVPMRIHGEASGTLTYYYRQPHQFSDRELRVATALANLAGAAIGGAELYDEQRRLRAEAQGAEWRSNFLSEASRVLYSTLDYEATLARVARLSVPTLADWCAVDILEEDRTLKRLAVAHVEPEKVEWAHELHRRYPPDPDAPRGISRVLRTGTAEIYPEITDEMLVTAAIDDEHLRLLRSVGFSSAMLVPLTARGRTYGVVTFIAAESGRRFGQQELALAEDLAGRAAVAVEHARLYLAAQNANRLKDEFLATVSHELRTPLTAILGWAHLLRRETADEAMRGHALEVIERNAYAQKQLIEDILDVSRIITGRLRIEAHPVELIPIVEAAREAVQPAAEAKGIRIESAYEPVSALILGDPDRLQQVVWNLLSNAVKFTPASGQVTLKVSGSGGSIDVAVADTGEGIAPDFLPHVFDRFRQADMGTTRRHGGLGLGLAIVRHLAEMHGGSVRVESEGSGRGSTFTLTLPLWGGEEAPPPHPAAGRNVEPGEPTARQIPNLDGVRLLLVEDESDTRALLETALSGYGAKVKTAGSAAEALGILRSARLDVLVTDIGMPEVDGYELLRQVRALGAEGGGGLPAVALTAYASGEDRARALNAGFQEHVPKPVEPAVVAQVIASLIDYT